jgi:hypothetical protein
MHHAHHGQFSLPRSLLLQFWYWRLVRSNDSYAVQVCHCPNLVRKPRSDSLQLVLHLMYHWSPNLQSCSRPHPRVLFALLLFAWRKAQPSLMSTIPTSVRYWEMDGQKPTLRIAGVWAWSPYIRKFQKNFDPCEKMLKLGKCIILCRFPQFILLDCYSTHFADGRILSPVSSSPTLSSEHSTNSTSYR